MNKYQLGQTLYWFKYSGSQPDLMSLEVGCIKQTKDGYKYGTGAPGGTWVPENICFETIQGAVNYGIQILKGFLNEQS